MTGDEPSLKSADGFDESGLGWSVMRGWLVLGARGLAIAFAIAVGLLVVTACGGADDEPDAAPPAPAFVYDGSEPLAFEERGPLGPGVRDVSYRSGEDRIDGYLVLPSKKGIHAAVVPPRRRR